MSRVTTYESLEHRTQVINRKRDKKLTVDAILNASRQGDAIAASFQERRLVPMLDSGTIEKAELAFTDIDAPIVVSALSRFAHETLNARDKRKAARLIGSIIVDVPYEFTI